MGAGLIIFTPNQNSRSEEIVVVNINEIISIKIKSYINRCFAHIFCFSSAHSKKIRLSLHPKNQISLYRLQDREMSMTAIHHHFLMQIAIFGIQNAEHKNCRWSKKESSDYITHKRQSELFAAKNTFGM